ncbi:cullin, putative [Entamoeba dispar SAW760]|uniref:Cullin, putative n=1 Tax=Entamoeba dispar (strain ATCC PRA-260 / SAW760) TaxID=370354 RepID=B0ECW4_ENTDS|nr:cullin, putative [Entamoeba dispar SAW760]EDR27656.1 cullin, putative [Entamoeba dispar SAW760]|eukprot:EDR27656.1 cullin, putative [Entamoeba dispar SAW760]
MFQSLYTQRYSEEQYSQYKNTLYNKFKEIMESKEVIDSGEVMLLYNIVYSICASQDDRLRERLYYDIYSFITRRTKDIIITIQSNKNQELLKSYNKEFEQFENGINYIERACKYLSKHTIETEIIKNGSNAKFKEISDIGKIEWKKNIFDLLEKQIQEVVITIIKQVRNEKSDNYEMNEIKKYCKTLIQLHSVKGSDVIGLYVSSFENDYLNKLKKYTKKWANTHIKELDMKSYLKEGLDLLKKEQQVIGCNLDSITFDHISLIMSDELWKEKKEVLKVHFEEAFETENFEYILLFYKVFNKCSNSNELLIGLSRSFGEWISSIFKKTLNGFTCNEPNDIGIELLNNYISCYMKVSEVLKLFNGNALFGEELKQRLNQFLNSPSNKYNELHPKFIAQYIDQLLRGVGVGKDSKEVILTKIEESMNILQAVQNKDIFMHFNSHYLARRLINKTVSIDEDIDKSSIDGIRSVCGFEYVSKMNHMVRDINNSVNLNAHFHELYKTPLYVNVLTSGIWPFSTENSLSNDTLPRSILLAQSKFEEEYLKKGKNKKLKWLNNLAKVNVIVTVGKYKYEMILAGIYYIVLDLINQYQIEWKSKSKIKEEDVERTEKVLTKLGIIENNHIKTSYFTDQKRKKIVIGFQEINQITKESQVNKELAQSRKVSLQAIIVRIMKQRKVIGHQQLKEEIMKISSSKFVPSTIMIKECIEFLIEKEYMKRKDDDPSTYEYVY